MDVRYPEGCPFLFSNEKLILSEFGIWVDLVPPTELAILDNTSSKKYIVDHEMDQQVNVLAAKLDDLIPRCHI